MTNREPIELGPAWTKAEKDIARQVEQVRSLLIHLQTIDEEYMFHFYDDCSSSSYIREKWVTFRRDQVAWVLSLDPKNFARLLELADQDGPPLFPGFKDD